MGGGGGGAAAGGGSWMGGSVRGYSVGSDGPVSGPGTSTSDSIHAMLSPGEFVVKAAAVREYGSNFLHAINNMQIAPPKYALGGMVPSSSIQRFAEGGDITSPGTPFHLHIGDQVFKDLTAPDNVAQQLKTYALDQATTSTGRKPSWVG